MADDVERVLADIDADNGDHAVLILGHGVLHRMAAPRQRAIAATFQMAADASQRVVAERRDTRR
jgi:hypothetical protein